MPLVESETGKIERQEEEARLAALASIGILDTPPESCYDAVTRLAAEYFQADSAGLGFADESRIWIKSHYGEHVRELPRKNSIFDVVLAEDGPVMVTDSCGQSTTRFWEFCPSSGVSPGQASRPTNCECLGAWPI